MSPSRSLPLTARLPLAVTGLMLGTTGVFAILTTQSGAFLPGGQGWPLLLGAGAASLALSALVGWRIACSVTRPLADAASRASWEVSTTTMWPGSTPSPMRALTADLPFVP